ncbi:MAG TPA: mechanosensitive ion channel family protein, partial [Clostridia bacterium]|nr:mechanosensitive ion channel family protein [Clostridia bacterium]
MIDEIKSWVRGWTIENYMVIGFKVLKIALIWALASMLIRIAKFIVNGFFEGQAKSRFSVNKKKNDTLNALTQSILGYVIYFIAIIMILGEMGINTASIIATAGIGGLAIGFGAQSLVKDIITGFFIIFEDQYSVGDFIKIEEISGTVEEIGLRITKLRGFKGDINIIPNGEISTVTNYSRGNSAAIVDMSIAYESDIDKAIRVMEKACSDYADGNPDIVEEPQVVGIVSMSDFGIILRVVGRTLPMRHWGVERD